MNVGNNDFVNLDAAMLQNWLDGEEGRTAAEGQKMQFLSPAMQKRVYGSVPTGTKVMKNDANDKSANGCARRSFLAFVLRECNADSKENLPPVVKKAMKLNSGWLHQRQDWNEGKNRPLTVRRIKSVMTAIYAHRAGVEGWDGDSKVCKDFWNALSPEQKTALRQARNRGDAGAVQFRDLFQDYKDFMNGLSSELKTALLKSENVDLCKNLFQNYHTLVQVADSANNGARSMAPDDFLREINRIYKTGCEEGLTNPIPLGLFKTGGTGNQNDQIGQCIMNQLSSTDYHLISDNISEDGNGVPSDFEKALMSFNREGGILTIDYKMKNKYGRLDDKSITLIGGNNGSPLKYKAEGGEEITVTRRGGKGTGTLSYAQLERVLEKIIGLTGNKLYALLNKPSSGGFTYYGVPEAQDYQKAFLKKNQLPANGSYSGDNKYIGKLSVVPKQQGSQDRKFMFTLSVKSNVASTLQNGIAFISYAPNDSENYQSLACTCEYNVSDNADTFRVSRLTYNMVMSMHRIGLIEEA